jgi:hypothetical protein
MGKESKQKRVDVIDNTGKDVGVSRGATRAEHTWQWAMGNVTVIGYMPLRDTVGFRSERGDIEVQ